MRKNQKARERGLKPLQKSFFSLLGQEKPKPIPPKLVLIYGYSLAAMISQLLFWKGMEKRKDGYIYKTEKNFISEIGATSAQQKLAIKKGKKYGFLKVQRMGIPAKRHYLLNYDKLVEATIKVAKEKNIVLSESHFKLGQNRLYKKGENNPTNTDNTTENTSRNHIAQSTKELLRKRYGGR